MKTIKKLFLLTVLGMGVYVNINAEPSIQAHIRAAVKSHQHKIATIKNSLQLNGLLATIKEEILKILHENENKLESKEIELKKALEQLNPADKISVASQIKSILANLESDIAATIKSAIPPVYQTILGL